MMQTEIYTELERRLGPLNEAAKQVASVLLELLGYAATDEPPAPSPQPLAFQGENPSFEEMATLDIEERSRVMQELEDRNREWLEQKCKELAVHWLVVVDGQVIAHGGPGLRGLAIDERVPTVGQQTGKFPLVFIHPTALAIEETSWHATATAGDFYPTLSLQLETGGVSISLTADFDTGAYDLYADADRLEGEGLISVGPGDRLYRSAHLSESFTYLLKTLTVALTADSVSQQTARDVVCVRDWSQSPFVVVNPQRTALVGRDLCLQLQPDVTLHFAQRETTLQW